jgi:hypothetical protein
MITSIRERVKDTMARPQQTYEEKEGDSFGRFQDAVKQILAVRKKEIDRRESEYQKTRKAVKKQRGA